MLVHKTLKNVNIMEIRSNMPSLLKMDIGKMKSMKLDV